MGSSFGKVRKYNLNPVGEPGKYSSLSEDTNRSSLTSLQTRSRPSTPGGASSLRSHGPPEAGINDIFRDTGRSEELLISGRETFPLPHLFRLHVNEDFVKNYRDAGDKSRDYHKESPQTSASPTVVDSQPVPPPLPPRNLKPGVVWGKSDSYYDPNPRPQQKEYTTQDINQMLRPMNRMNAEVLQGAAFQNASRHEAFSSPSYHTLHYPPGYTPNCTCERARIHEPHQRQRSMIPQQAYSYRQETPQPPSHQRSHSIHIPQQYRYPLPYTQPRPDLRSNPVRSVQPDVRYNTISLDTVMRPEYSPSYGVEQPQQLVSSGYHQDVTKRSTLQNAPYGVNSRKTKDEIKEAAQTNHDRFYQTGVLNQPTFNDNEFGAGDHRHCHTIPEEVSWPPPFHYDPALRNVHPTGFRY